MKKRMIIMLSAVAAFLAIIGFVKFRQVQAAIALASSFQPPPEAVTTIVAKEETWRQTVSSIGTVAAVNGVTVSADLPGLVEKIAFDSGEAVREGDVLLLLDSRQEQAQLAAAEARLELARLSYERFRGLLETGAVSQAEHDSAAAEQRAAEANVRQIRATIARKTIRAPFSGVLGIRQVNLGQYLTGGSPIVPLQTLDPVYVNFGVPQQQLSRVRVGASVRVQAEGLPGAEFEGRITAIDSVVEESTRNIAVQSTLANPQRNLRPGMFVTAEVMLESKDEVIALPSTAINHAPYGDSVFVVEDQKGPNGQTYRGVRQQIVKLGAERGDQVAVLSGLEPGQEIVTSGVFKLRNGGPVQVNNEIQPENSPAPSPAEN